MELLFNNGEACKAVPCKSTPTATGLLASNDNAVRIDSSVGLNGVNREEDTCVIQRALNKVPADQGGPVKLLKQDGICGPKTNKAIQTFQLKHFGWSGADGKVDPERQTIAKLNELVDFSPDANGPQRVQRITSLLGEAQRRIRSAEINLSKALLVGGIPGSLTGSGSKRLANLHFKVHEHPFGPLFAMRQANSIYRTMLMVFAKPGGLWGASIFAPDPVGQRIVGRAVAYQLSPKRRFFPTR